jgi:uncharacterized membrane protein YdbT with pleckstrin-like domain
MQMPDLFVSHPSNAQKHASAKKRFDPLSSYCEYPAHAFFDSMDEEETIILLLRKHPITNLPWIIIAAVLVALPFLFNVLPITSVLPARFYLVGLLAWYLIVLAYVFESFISWFFNVYIVTDERIVDVDFLHLVYRQISYAKIDQIQDITSEMGGVVRTIFNYGDVLIQTAAEISEFTFEAVPVPDQVIKTLSSLQAEEEQEKLEGRVR